ncbi:excinuclease ABC subunit UvrB [Microbacterium sp.]|uniref:excinuclease ABC subunit UvrB n=1 Tax=Microbacterium sp. TaxID=51671 RepID=UPI0027359A13|nr:excinuclease ABC subunit UvrB [Microbacterium sp.]MDP3952825.1 excinuclease ABC subunit UvrB [Microbacterium sp.]
MKFKLHAPYSPAGDQPKAIEQLVEGLRAKERKQTLLGVTGSGKTYTMANVIERTQKPTLVIAHNKTLAAQLCNEFREFFPDNAVEYFVSYYDYYQPEAYLPRSDTYIEKESQINDEIDRLRHAATQAILSRRDVIIVASVSCIYGLGSPDEYKKTVLHLRVGEGDRSDILHKLVAMQFERTTADLTRGTYRVRGDVLELMPVNEETVYRLAFENDVPTKLDELDPVTRRLESERADLWIFPATHFVSPPSERERVTKQIEEELKVRLDQLDKEGKVLEAERLTRRTRYDIEMIRNVGYCSGIENYSRHFDGRSPGTPPYTLIDYFPKDFLTVIDESHVTVTQVGGMYEGDRSRKDTLVEHGFRLPSARDNRPLTFDEFEKRLNQTVFVSATPGKYEKANSERVVEQIIRPTGLIDPEVIVRPVTAGVGNWALGAGQSPNPKAHLGQVDDLIGEIKKRAALHERTLVTTLTKKMAEDLAEFLTNEGIKVRYLHSDIETLERITILTELRRGDYDVLVGVNLLREGLDLPEVTLVAILDADKEGFLRSETSLIQTIGRAARNVKGQVLLYADQSTGSLARALKETDRRRERQLAWNKEHGITPKTIEKKIKDIREMLGAGEEATTRDILKIELIAEPHELRDVIDTKEREMKEAARHLDFETAAILRDEIVLLKKELKGKETVPEKKSKKKKKE